MCAANISAGVNGGQACADLGERNPIFCRTAKLCETALKQHRYERYMDIFKFAIHGPTPQVCNVVFCGTSEIMTIVILAQHFNIKYIATIGPEERPIL
jgi:hypothetical protein